MKTDNQDHRSQTNAARTSWSSIGPIGFALFVCLVLTQLASGMDEKSIKQFTEAMVKLSPNVDPAEAQTISETAHHTARKLAQEYRVVGPAVLQNFLIHIGAREKGYCFHWARDIGTQLKALRPRTLDYHWGAAEQGTVGEHNVIVVTARGQDFRTGYIIDGWRNAGRLCWWPVTKDSGYKWKEDVRETAWIRDYAPLQEKAQAATAGLISKAARQKPQPAKRKPPIAPKPEETTASIEISG